MGVIELERLRERNCANCYHLNSKYKILGCKIHNRQITKDYCCVLHFFQLEAD